MAWRWQTVAPSILCNVQLETFTIIQILEEKVGMKIVDLASLKFRRWFTKIPLPIRVPEVCFDFVVSANLTSSGSKAECRSGH